MEPSSPVMKPSYSGSSPKRGTLQASEIRTCFLFLSPVLFILVALVFYPFLYGVSLSFTSRMVGSAGEFVGYRNFLTIWRDPVFAVAARNSAVLTLATVGVKLVLGLISALLLHQEFPLRSLARGLVFLPWTIPTLIAALSWKWVYDEMSGILNYLLYRVGLTQEFIPWLSDGKLALLSIMVVMIWQGMPFYTMMFLAGLSAIPSELYEAGMVDGATSWQRFWHITLPSLRDIIAIVVMLSSIWTFNGGFNMVYILTRGGPANRTQIIPTLAYEYGIVRGNLALSSAVLVYFLPVFLAVIVLLTRKMFAEESSK